MAGLAACGGADESRGDREEKQRGTSYGEPICDDLAEFSERGIFTSYSETRSDDETTANLVAGHWKFVDGAASDLWRMYSEGEPPEPLREDLHAVEQYWYRLAQGKRDGSVDDGDLPAIATDVAADPAHQAVDAWAGENCDGLSVFFTEAGGGQDEEEQLASVVFDYATDEGFSVRVTATFLEPEHHVGIDEARALHETCPGPNFLDPTDSTVLKVLPIRMKVVDTTQGDGFTNTTRTRLSLEPTTTAVGCPLYDLLVEAGDFAETRLVFFGNRTPNDPAGRFAVERPLAGFGLRFSVSAAGGHGLGGGRCEHVEIQGPITVGSDANGCRFVLDSAG